MLKITVLSNSTLKAFKVDVNKIVSNSDSKTHKTVINISKNLMHMLNIKVTKKLTFLIANAKKTVYYLRQAFIKASIFYYLKLENYIQIEINTSCYSISRMLC